MGSIHLHRRHFLAGSAALAKDYLKAVRLRGVMVRELNPVLARYDCIVHPTIGSVTYPIDKPFAQAWPPVPVPPGTRTVPVGSAANIVGLPGLSVPNGFGREGLPTAIAFTGALWNETQVITAASEFQSRTEWHTRRPTAFMA